MPRPCLTRHPEPVAAGCRVCWLYLNDPRYRALWDLPPGGAAVAPKANTPGRTELPCVHRGEVVPGRDRDRLGLDHRRNWTACNHPDQPRGEYVCRCLGCGVRCPGYLAVSEEEEEF